MSDFIAFVSNKFRDYGHIGLLVYLLLDMVGVISRDTTSFQGLVLLTCCVVIGMLIFLAIETAVLNTIKNVSEHRRKNQNS